MLGLCAAAALGATVSPQQEPLVPDNKNSLVCVSTSVDTSTATCNHACRTDEKPKETRTELTISLRKKCPDACFCLASGYMSISHLSMPVAELARLTDELKSGGALSLSRDVGSQKKCKSLVASVQNEWCTKNCNGLPGLPVLCPEAVCSCDEAGQHSPEWKALGGEHSDVWKARNDPQTVAENEAPVWKARYTKEEEEKAEADDAPGSRPEWAPVRKPAARQPVGADASAPAHPKYSWERLSASRPATLPDELIRGFYQKTWVCKSLDSPACQGPVNKTLNVAFSGENTLENALARALQQGNACEHEERKFCEDQIRYMRPGKRGSPVENRAQAIRKVIAPGSWTADKCKGCFANELPGSQRPTELQVRHPFSQEAGLHKGVQFLDIGGASSRGVLTAESLRSSFTAEGLEQVKDAGFQGVCFDIELTRGEEKPLVQEFERAFAACKRAGLLVMVTTSHSAPYAASEKAKDLLISSWRRSRDIDIFSPQLYTSGFEGSPELMLTPCRSGGGWEKSECTWERLKPIKARWILSLASEDHYEAAHEFFRDLGIKVSGFVQWKDPLKDLATAEAEVKKDSRDKNLQKNLLPKHNDGEGNEQEADGTSGPEKKCSDENGNPTWCRLTTKGGGSGTVVHKPTQWISDKEKKCVDAAGNPAWCSEAGTAPAAPSSGKERKCVDAEGNPAWCNNVGSRLRRFMIKNHVPAPKRGGKDAKAPNIWGGGGGGGGGST